MASPDKDGGGGGGEDEVGIGMVGVVRMRLVMM